MDLIFRLCFFYDFFQIIERPIHPDKRLSFRTFLPCSRETAEMASPCASFFVVKKKVESFEFRIPVEGASLEVQRQRSGQTGLNILRTCFLAHLFSFRLSLAR